MVDRQDGDQPAQQAEQRADRQVDLPGDDDEHHAARQHARDGHLQEQVGDAVGLEEGAVVWLQKKIQISATASSASTL
ncbi:hypothetical protein [Ralstonia solanacearum]|uniref:hypothetical protein n=1 Tax=Ralstonia solanacearum TaxID=305 RepID=UPI001F24479B|nr:hypothetical protein [Ralstonia solanacearum]